MTWAESVPAGLVDGWLDRWEEEQIDDPPPPADAERDALRAWVDRFLAWVRETDLDGYLAFFAPEGPPELRKQVAEHLAAGRTVMLCDSRGHEFVVYPDEWPG